MSKTEHGLRQPNWHVYKEGVREQCSITQKPFRIRHLEEKSIQQKEDANNSVNHPVYVTGVYLPCYSVNSHFTYGTNEWYG